MDLFDAYSELRTSKLDAFANRALRLMSVSAFVYDDDYFYFELNEPRLWGRLSEGAAAIGVRAPRVQPNGAASPQQGLVQYLRRSWGADVDLLPAGHGYLLDEAGAVHVLPDLGAHMPYLFILTPPRLGGGEMPDALVQVVYLLPLQRIRAHKAEVSLLQVARERLADFLDRESWTLAEARAATWIKVTPVGALPGDACLRPVLALRSLGRLLEQDVLPGSPMADETSSAEGEEPR